MTRLVAKALEPTARTISSTVGLSVALSKMGPSVVQSKRMNLCIVANMKFVVMAGVRSLYWCLAIVQITGY
jgi:hypothetical protein